MPFLTLDQLHPERPIQVARHSVRVPRVGLDRILELGRGSGEFRQQQHAGIGGVLRRHAARYAGTET